MKTGVLILALSSILFAASAQILLRVGMTSASVQKLLEQNAERLGAMFLIIANPFVASGLVLYGVGAFLWLLVLARVPVTVAYPFVGLGFIVTLFLGWLLLSEQVTSLRVLGTFLVVVGVVLVGKSAGN